MVLLSVMSIFMLMVFSLFPWSGRVRGKRGLTALWRTAAVLTKIG